MLPGGVERGHRQRGSPLLSGRQPSAKGGPRRGRFLLRGGKLVFSWLGLAACVHLVDVSFLMFDKKEMVFHEEGAFRGSKPEAPSSSLV